MAQSLESIPCTPVRAFRPPLLNESISCSGSNLDAKVTNVWLGVSVENRRHGVPRIDVLRHIPAKIRFLSCEPLLEDLGAMDLTGIHWVIVGGESGPKARPMHPDWARAIRVQCDAQGATFFFKQWGGWGADGKRRLRDPTKSGHFGQTSIDVQQV